MKKRIIFTILGLLIASTAIAGSKVLPTKKEAVNTFNTYKPIREASVDLASDSLIYTSDKVC